MYETRVQYMCLFLGCKDLAKAKKCKKLKNKKKCSKKWVAEKCPKTCGKCTAIANNNEDVCKDTANVKKCVKLKNKGKCSKKWVAEKCSKTCGLCQESEDGNNLFIYNLYIVAIIFAAYLAPLKNPFLKPPLIFMGNKTFQVPPVPQ